MKLNEDVLTNRVKSVFDLNDNQIYIDSENQIRFNLGSDTFKIINPSIREDDKKYYWMSHSQYNDIGFNFSENVLFKKKTKMVRKINELRSKVSEEITLQYKENIANEAIQKLYQSDSFSQNFGEIQNARFDRETNIGPVVTVYTTESDGTDHTLIFDVTLNNPYLRLKYHTITYIQNTGEGSPITNWVNLQPSEDNSSSEEEIEDDSIPDPSNVEDEQHETQSE